MAAYQATRHVHLFFFSFLWLIVIDGQVDLIVVNESEEGRSSVKASFIYIMQSASRSHRRQDDRCVFSQRRLISRKGSSMDYFHFVDSRESIKIVSITRRAN